MRTGCQYAFASRRCRRALCACLTLLPVAFCLARPTYAADIPLEYEIEAAYLFNFTKFVQWPSSAFASDTAPFNICIVGEDHLGKPLEAIVQGESVAGHKIVVERMQASFDKSCQVAFFDNPPPSADVPASGAGVLTVGLADAFLQRGGMIAFVLQDRRVRFDVSLKAASAGGLKLSSKMLSVARSVEQ